MSPQNGQNPRIDGIGDSGSLLESFSILLFGLDIILPVSILSYYVEFRNGF